MPFGTAFFSPLTFDTPSKLLFLESHEFADSTVDTLFSHHPIGFHLFGLILENISLDFLISNGFPGANVKDLAVLKDDHFILRLRTCESVGVQIVGHGFEGQEFWLLVGQYLI